MKKSNRYLFLEEQMFILRQTLNKLLCTEPVDSEMVLRLSERLDTLISEYYILKKDSHDL